MRWAVVLLWSAGVVWAQDRASFGVGLSDVRTHLLKGRGARAEKDLRALLDTHRERDYVVAQRADVADLMRRCVFRRQFPQPKPKDLVSGKLLFHTLETGRVRLKYKPDTMDDFLGPEHEFWIHPAIFRGPHSITIHGRTPLVLVCIDGDRSFLIDWHRISSVSDGRVNVLATGSGPDGKTRRHVIHVKKNEITVARNGKTYLRAKKPASSWGRIALQSEFRWIKPKFKELIIDGPAEPAWLQGLVDAKTQEQLEAFEGAYREEEHLPEWLGAAAKPSGPVGDDLRLGNWPALTEDGRDAVLNAFENFKAGDFAKGLLVVRDLPTGVLPASVRCYLIGYGLEGQERLDEALAAFEESGRMDPDFRIRILHEATLLERLWRYEEALEAYETVLRAVPRSSGLQARRARLLLKMDRFDEARAAVAEAVAIGLSSTSLTRTKMLIDMAVRGPRWRRTHHYKSKHYDVYSDMGKATCQKAAQQLESAYRLFSETLEQPPKSTRRFRVYLFSGRAGYQNYVRDLIGEEQPHTAGLYQPDVKQLLIWNLPERAEMMRTVRHEGLHQYMRRIMDSPPTWFDEGLAEYFERADKERALGGSHPPNLRQLRGPWIPLDEFLRLSNCEFMEKANRHYAYAWALIHFLRSDVQNRAIFNRMWTAYKTIPSKRKAVEKAFEGVDRAKFEAAFERYVDEMVRRDRTSTR